MESIRIEIVLHDPQVSDMAYNHNQTAALGTEAQRK